MNIELIKQKLNAIKSTSVTNTNLKSTKDYVWKLNPGRYIARIVPYKYNKDNPFCEIYFYYDLNGKNYVSPISYGEPDPIVEFAKKLRASGDKENYKLAKSIEPKLRVYVPAIIRGYEDEGIKFLALSKTLYAELLSIIVDPEYGDITDIKTGRDIIIEVLSPKESGTNFKKISIRVKPNVSEALSNLNELYNMIENEINIQQLFVPASYETLKNELKKMFNIDNDEMEYNKNINNINTKSNDYNDEEEHYKKFKKDIKENEYDYDEDDYEYESKNNLHYNDYNNKENDFNEKDDIKEKTRSIENDLKQLEEMFKKFSNK